MIKFIYLRFLTEQDAEKGIELLSERFEVAIEDGVCCVPPESLAVLDGNGICYTVARPESISSSRGRGWRIAKQHAAAEG
ncbi:MAG: hypothetical protein P4L33_12850 [Capsulimonadaceae bacterium]|nr:hypothetical protein [Capsulimonadaceae bacterium]